MHGNSRHGSPQSTQRGAFADTERIVGLLEPAVAALGMDLENVRITSAGRRRLLRIVVDADGGVSLDDIATVSREVSATLDRAAAMGETPYTLEVSSPGVDRPLTEPKHWRRAIGRLVTVPLRGGPERQPPQALLPSSPGQPGTATGSPVITGRVTGTDSRGVRINVHGAGREFRYSELGPGIVQIEFAPQGAHGEDGADEEGPDGY